MSRPFSSANNSAPRPASITWPDCVITACAAVIGFLIVVTPATAPAIRLLPSITEASSSFLPSCVKTAPFPALKSGESSNILIVATTASILLPPLSRIAKPVSSASRSLWWYFASFSALRFDLRIVPAPPCTTIVMGPEKCSSPPFCPDFFEQENPTKTVRNIKNHFIVSNWELE